MSAERHGIGAEARAEADADGQFLGPFQEGAAGDAFEPGLHLPRDLAEVEAEEAGAGLVHVDGEFGRAAVHAWCGRR